VALIHDAWSWIYVPQEKCHIILENTLPLTGSRQNIENATTSETFDLLKLNTNLYIQDIHCQPSGSSLGSRCVSSIYNSEK